METFTASVQYGDWRGTSAADDDGKNDIRDFLVSKGLLDRDTDFLIAVDVWVGENHNGVVKTPHINALIYDGTGVDNLAAEISAAPDPLQVKRVSVDLTLEEFVGLFKRFNVSLTHRAFDLTDRTYVATDVET